MANGKWQMANGKWQMTNRKSQITNDEGEQETAKNAAAANQAAGLVMGLGPAGRRCVRRLPHGTRALGPSTSRSRTAVRLPGREGLSARSRSVYAGIDLPAGFSVREHRPQRPVKSPQGPPR